MKKFTLLGAAAILFMSLATPVMAQRVISEPGYCAQFYPNANCQNEGPNNPYTGDYQRRILHICSEGCLRARRHILPGP
jgi:hypothetical protein